MLGICVPHILLNNLITLESGALNISITTWSLREQIPTGNSFSFIYFFKFPIYPIICLSLFFGPLNSVFLSQVLQKQSVDKFHFRQLPKPSVALPKSMPVAVRVCRRCQCMGFSEGIVHVNEGNWSYWTDRAKRLAWCRVNWKQNPVKVLKPS